MIINSKIEKIGNKIRIYSAPVFVKSNEEWKRLSDVIQITEKDGEFNIKVEDVEAKLKLLTETVVKNVETGLNFGHILDKNSSDIIEYEITLPEGKTIENNKVILKDYGDVKICLNFCDWIKYKPVISGNKIIIDIKEAKKVGDINLDPIISIDSSESGYLNTYDDTSWSNARSATPSVYTGSYSVYVSGYSSSYYIYRTFLRFDLSSYRPLTSAYLKLPYTGFTESGGSGEAIVLKIAKYSDLSTSNWNDYETGSSVSTIPFSTLDTEGGTISIDVLSHITDQDVNCFTVMDYNKDYNNNEPIDEEYSLYLSVPYLEIEQEPITGTRIRKISGVLNV